MGTVIKKTVTKPVPAGAETFVRKGERFARWKDRKGKMRTAPLTVGQEFSGYAQQLKDARRAIRAALPAVHELALGGTAVGTGLNADERFAPRAIEIIAERTRLPVREADNHFEAQGGKDACVETSGTGNVASQSTTPSG